MFWLFFQLVGVVLAIGAFCLIVPIVIGIVISPLWLIARICIGIGNMPQSPSDEAQILLARYDAELTAKSGQ